MYPAEIVVPMKEELTDNGFVELQTPEQVDASLAEGGTNLLVINSVCGCSAGTARPGVLMAIANAEKKPDHLTTSFAGFDLDAVKRYASICFLILLRLLPLRYLKMANWCTSLKGT